jgi:hypothetical protein
MVKLVQPVTLGEVLARLPDHRRSGRYYVARCPKHKGGNPTALHIWAGADGSVGLKCHAHDCDYWDILAVIGLGKERKTPDTAAPPPSKPVALVEVERYVMPLSDGGYVEHVRLEGDGQKSFQWYRDGKLGLDGMKATDVPLYGMEKLDGDSVVVCEGEKAATALMDVGIKAVGTVGGVSVTPSDAILGPLLACRVHLWADNDDVGRDHMDNIAERLRAMGHQDVRHVEWAEAPPKGDAFDAVASGVDVRALIGAAPAPQIPFDAAVHRLGLKTVADWIDQPEQPTEWIIDGLLASEALTMLCAFPKAGKSVFARAMAYAVATGTPFLGRETRQGTVIYAALEEMESQVKQSFRAMGLTKDIPLHIKFGRANQHFLVDLRTCIEELGAPLVIIDTFVRIPREKSPESSDYLGNSELLEPLVYLAHETKTAVVPLYHTTKAGRNAEGYEAVSAVMSNAGIVGSVDQLISLIVQSDGTRGFQSYGRLEPVPITLYSYDRATEVLAVLGTKEDVTHQAVREAVMDACDLVEWVTNADLKKNVPHGATAVTKAIRELYGEAMLEQKGAGRSGAPYEYRRVESPFAVLPLDTEQRTDIETEEEEEGEWAIF